MNIVERKGRNTGSRRTGKRSYPRDKFKYLAYETDPAPDVLVLGTWKNPGTKNSVIAGINLNYLSSGQLVKLRKAVDRVFKRDSLRARYRYIKSILPDIAMFYRTYDTKYIKSIEHGELDSYTKAKSSPNDEKIKTAADADKLAHASETQPEKSADDLDREAWQLKRRLYEPEKQRRRTSPERLGIAGSKAAEKAKRTRYVRDRKKLKELERQVALAKELRNVDKPRPQDELRGSEDLERELGLLEPETDDLDYDDEYHLDDLGYESKTPRRSITEEYVIDHTHDDDLNDVITLWGWDPHYPDEIETYIATSKDDIHINCLDYDRLRFQGRHIASRNVLYGYDTNEEEDRPDRDSSYYGNESWLNDLHHALERRFPGHKVVDAFSVWSRPTKHTYKSRDMDPVGHWGEGTGYDFTSEVGYVWKSKSSYVDNHKTANMITESKGTKLLAVYDLTSKQFIIDSVISHIEILFDAGWDYDHTVLFEVEDNELIVTSECSDQAIKEAIACFRKHPVKNILCEHNITEKRQTSTKPYRSGVLQLNSSQGQR